METARSIRIIMVGNTGTIQLINKLSLLLLAHSENGHGHRNDFYINDSRKCSVEKEHVQRHHK
jgi:hypothetical protein